MTSVIMAAKKTPYGEENTINDYKQATEIYSDEK